MIYIESERANETPATQPGYTPPVVGASAKRNTGVTLPGSGGMMDGPEQYLRILEHERHMETRALTGLGHFIAANAFMIVAWSQFYQRFSPDRQPFGFIDVLLALIALFGYVSGLLWASLGARNWGYARRLVAELITLGSRITRSDAAFELYRILRGVEDAARLSRSGTIKGRPMLTSHPSLLRLVPLSLSAIYIALWTVWGTARFHGHTYWFISTLPAAFAVLGIFAVYVLSKEEEMAVEVIVDKAKDAADAQG